MRAASSWTTSWIAPPQALWSGDFALPTLVPFQFVDQTLRQTLRLSLGGERLRIEFSNEHGTVPLRIAAASVARAAQAAGSVDVLAGSSRALRFGGETSVTIPPGARAVSDPVDLPSRDLERLSVSLYLAGPASPSTFHWEGRDTTHVAPGDRTGDLTWAGPVEVLSTRVYLSAVLVERREAPAAVVVLGDSITDGNGSTPGENRRWPDRLAERLAPHGLAVLNAGNSGGRLISDGMGRGGLARLQRDALGHPGVRTMIVLLGTNDIGWPQGPFAPQEPPMTAERLIAGLRQLIAQARAVNVRVIGATIPPNEDALHGTPLAGHHSEAKDRVRQEVNAWIRTAGTAGASTPSSGPSSAHGTFDGVIDVDALLRDPDRPARLLPAFDSGDHLHPGDAGYAALAEAVDLDLLLEESIQPE